MGGAVDSSNGGSQPVHLTNRTSNANKQPIRRSERSFATVAHRLFFLYAFSSSIFSFLVEVARASDQISACVEFRGV